MLSAYDALNAVAPEEPVDFVELEVAVPDELEVPEVPEDPEDPEVPEDPEDPEVPEVPDVVPDVPFVAEPGARLALAFAARAW
jgi:hypothetical protein